MEFNDYIRLYSRLLFSGDKECALALNYLKTNRQLSEDTIRLFDIGYCGKRSEIPKENDEKILIETYWGKSLFLLDRSSETFYHLQ